MIPKYQVDDGRFSVPLNITAQRWPSHTCISVHLIATLGTSAAMNKPSVIWLMPRRRGGWEQHKSQYSLPNVKLYLHAQCGYAFRLATKSSAAVQNVEKSKVLSQLHPAVFVKSCSFYLCAGKASIVLAVCVFVHAKIENKTTYQKVM